MMRWTAFYGVLIAIVCTVWNDKANASADIIGLGGVYNSISYGVSSDGSVVVGSAKFFPSSFIHAFRSTNAGVLQDLGTLGGLRSTSQGVNADGSVVVGWSNMDVNSNLFHAFRWTEKGGMKDIGTLGGNTSVAYAVSSNGIVVVGSADTAASTTHAFRWTEKNGMQDICTNGCSSSVALGVNADGSVVVGSANISSSFIHAFEWTQMNGMQDLGTLGGPTSVAYGVNADGSVVVGWASTPSTIHAFLKPQGVDMQDLGVLPGYSNSVAYAVNANGSVNSAVVVGFCQNLALSKAFRWTQAVGMQSVEDWIISNGGKPLLSGNYLSVANGVSADGNVVVGNGFLNGQAQAFIAANHSVIGVDDFHGSLTQSLVAGAMLHNKLRDSLSIDLQNNAPRKGQFAFSSQAVYSDYTRDLAEGSGLKGIFKLIYGITDSLRAGLGYIPGRQRIKLDGDGNIRNDVNIFGGLLSYGDYRGDGIRARISGAYGTGDADITRNYLTGSGPDQSAGRMNVHQSGYVAELGYGFRVMPKTLVTPLLSYEFVRTRFGAYTESGGSFPAEFGARTIKDSFVRGGARLNHELTEKVAITLEGYYVNRLTGTGNPISGSIAGLGDIGAFSENVEVSRNWTELRAGIEYIPDWLTKNLHLTLGYEASLGQRFDAPTHRVDTGFVLYF